MKRIFKSKRLTIVSIIVTSLLLLGGVSLAANSAKQEPALDKVSQEGYMAMQEAGFARVAIFDGQLKEAQDLIKNAQDHLKAAKENAPELTVTVKAVEKSGDKTLDSAEITETNDLVPINVGLTMAEDFVATPEKTEKIKKAGGQMMKGNHTKAHEILKGEGIGVSVTRLLMPLDFVSSQVDKASDLFNDHKYYEANIALKKAADSLIVDTVVYYEPDPAQQHKDS